MLNGNMKENLAFPTDTVFEYMQKRVKTEDVTKYCLKKRREKCQITQRL